MRAENRNLLLGTMVGMMVGGAAVLLLTPRSGEEMRQRMREMTGQARESAREMAARGREYVETKRTQLQEAMEAGRRAAEEKRAQLQAELAAQTQPAPQT